MLPCSLCAAFGNDVLMTLKPEFLYPSRAFETLDLRGAAGQTVVWHHI